MDTTIHNKRGFTLIELLVSLALFAVVMMVSIGALLTLVDANRKAQALKSVTNNLNFAMDSMTRTLRTGYDYHCGSGWSEGSTADCASGDTELTFVDDNGDTVRYYLDEDAQAIMRRINGGVAERMTAPEARIEEARFFVRGTTRGDEEQPQVTILIQGTAGTAPETETSFNIQTTVVQRILDI